MRLVIQRTRGASVSINDEVVGRIDHGLLLLLGIEDRDTDDDIEWLCQKVVKMRIFDDADGVPNLCVTDIPGADILLVSQFTLMASTKKGNRPSYIRASRPETAIPLYEKFIRRLGELMGHPVQTGRFGAMMQVSLVNDGPHTIIMDSQNKDLF